MNADRQTDEDGADRAAYEEREHQCWIFTFARGSSASRSPSPNTFSDRTVSTIAMPGASDEPRRA